MNRTRLLFVFVAALVFFSFVQYVWWWKQGIQKISGLRKAELPVNNLNYVSIGEASGRTVEPYRRKLSPNCTASLFLLILVFSAPSNFARRGAIRSSWMWLLRNSFASQDFVATKAVFLLGKAEDWRLRKLVAREARNYDDMVIGSFLDSYPNLTLKTKYGFEWASLQCKFQYLLKTDDDVFVNVNGLIKWLWKSPRKKFYTGRCDSKKKVVREQGHKWAVSEETYKNNTYPTYCVGLGYILTFDVVKKIMRIIYSHKLLFVEDVYVGTLCQSLQIKPIDNRRFFGTKFRYPEDICRRQNLLLAHRVGAKLMLEVHLKYLNIPETCSRPLKNTKVVFSSEFDSTCTDVPDSKMF